MSAQHTTTTSLGLEEQNRNRVENMLKYCFCERAHVCACSTWTGFSVWYFVLTVVQSRFYVLEFVLNLTKAVICLWKF